MADLLAWLKQWNQGGLLSWMQKPEQPRVKAPITNSLLAGLIKSPFQAGVQLYKWVGQLSRLLPWDQSADPNSFFNKTQAEGKQYMWEIDSGIDPFFFWKNLEDKSPVVEGAAGMLLPTWAGSASLKWANLLWKSKFLSDVAAKVPALARYGAPLAKSFAGTAGFDVANQWELGWGTVLWTGLGTMIGWVRKATDLAEKVWFSKDKLASSLHMDGVISKKAQAEIIDKLGLKTKESLSKWFTDRGFNGTIQQIKQQAVQRKEEAKKLLWEFYARSSQNPNIKLQASGVEDMFTALKDDVVPKSLQKELLSIKNAFEKSKKLAPNQMQRLKQIGDKVLKIWNTSGDLPVAKENLAAARSTLQNALQNLWKKVGVNVEQLNKEIQIGNIMEADLLKKEIGETIKSWLLPSGMTGAWFAGLGYTGAQASGSDNPWMVAGVSLVAWLLVGAAIKNPAIATKIANYMKKNAPKEMLELERFKKTNGKVWLSEKVIERLAKLYQEGLDNLTK